MGRNRLSTRSTAGATRRRPTIAGCAKLLSAHPQCYPSVGVIEDWEFPWMRPVLRTEPMSESELVRQQGGWVFAGSIANSILGFAFWALAAHLFTSTAVGTAGALVSLSSLATSIGILGLDNGLVRFAARVDRPRALMWRSAERRVGKWRGRRRAASGW